MASDPNPVTRKVFAYITHGDRLLVFRHVDAPEAGVQVPAGTLHDGEAPEEGVMREAVEETGLMGLTLVGYLGDTWIDWSGQGREVIHHRLFYHLRCESQPLETWRHAELDPSDGSEGPIWFEFEWAPLADAATLLSFGHGALLSALEQRMSSKPC